MSEKQGLTRREIRRRKRRNAIIIKVTILVILLVLLAVAIWVISGGAKKSGLISKGRTSTTQTADGSGGGGEGMLPGAVSGETEASEAVSGEQPGNSSVPTNRRAAALNEARMKMSQYDYDAAMDVLTSVENYDSDAEIISLMADIETQKSNLVPVSAYDVTHIFFHSLVVDPARGFSLTGDPGWDFGTVGFCEWMTTVYEFDQLMQQMYDRGYVLISIYDMIEETTDESGVVHISPKDIYLPQGKTPFVMSLDDTCYYHSYDDRGTASKLIIGDDGTPTCEYIDASGQTLVGSYDCIPRLDDFIDLHPDFSYKGAKGTVALTGYNGILGYRTDYCYRDRVDLDLDQEIWLEEHPDFDWNAECEAAKAVADCIRADGWAFASHTWGHIAIGDATMESVMADTQKWLEYVAPLVGGTDIVIYAHGQDMSSWDVEYDSTEKFQFMKSQGFNIFCNVDSSQLFVQIGDTYLRMGRRNLDGYRIWEAVYKDNDLISDLCDAKTVIDPERPTDPSLYEL